MFAETTDHIATAEVKVELLNKKQESVANSLRLLPTNLYSCVQDNYVAIFIVDISKLYRGYNVV